MHELSIACEIVHQVEEIARAQALSRVVRVHVRVGALSGVVPEALAFAWPSACEGSACSGAVLQIQDGSSPQSEDLDLLSLEVE